MPRKGQPQTGLGAKGVLRPHIWLCGPDPYKHSMYMPWQKAHAQSRYRNRNGLEQGEFLLSFEDFFTLWNGKWEYRGRDSHDLCLTRRDAKKPWTLENCEIVERMEHLRRQGLLQTGKKKVRRR